MDKKQRLHRGETPRHKIMRKVVANNYSAAGMRSIPIYGRKTSGITMEPSAC
jgi:hypothetical protein